MNRLHHLKETLLKNIQDNEDYPNMEFILLDYDSRDGMEEWARGTLKEYIESGKLIYYKMYDLDFFNHSHAKNIALKLGTGDIVCSINADHYLGRNFANYINHIFNCSEKSVITPIPRVYYRFSETHPPSGSWGKVCVRKHDFLAIKGFDESMVKYGNDDIDLINRLEMHGVKRHCIRRAEYCNVISHSNEERHSSKGILNNIYRIYVYYLTPNRSEILYLFQQGKFERFVLNDQTEKEADNYKFAYLNRKYRYQYAIENFFWEEGSWTENSDHLILTSGTENNKKVSQLTCSEEFGYYQLLNDELIDDLSSLNYTHYNLNKMQKNLIEKKVNVNNENAFGNGIVYKNFDRLSKIVI